MIAFDPVMEWDTFDVWLALNNSFCIAVPSVEISHTFNGELHLLKINCSNRIESNCGKIKMKKKMKQQLSFLFTWKATRINHVDIVMSKWHINTGQHTNSVDRRRRVKFLIWQHRSMGNQPVQSIRRMRLVPSTRNL